MTTERAMAILGIIYHVRTPCKNLSFPKLLIPHLHL
ncbi:hypothetical protein HZ326_11980, partial [Fusarium oxysporum f. sp. albedinis]